MTQRRTVIVTGASSGIGYALAERAARAGYDVVAVGRRAERLARLAASIAGATGSVTTLALDLRSPGAAARVVALAREATGRIDVLVNNAGGVAVGSIAEQSDAALREQVETHVVVPLALTREALPSLRASRGHVFFVGSGVARVPVTKLGAYPPVKAAVRSAARIARMELRGDGIAVTYVDPGAVATEFMTRAGFAGPPPGIAASPQRVARAIFAAFATRPRVVNAVPWQTTATALAERFPRLVDALLERFPQIVGGDLAPSAVAEPAATGPAPSGPAAPEAVSPAAAPPSTFEAALGELAPRMARASLRPAFVRDALVPGARLEAAELAARWAGMPNKHERALTEQVLGALAAAGFLGIEPGGYRVLRGPED